MTTPNAELAYRVLDHIDVDPNSWDQNAWVSQTGCGTAACFAGWACILSGGVPAYDFDDDSDGAYVTQDGERHYIPRRAAELLGVDVVDVYDRWGLGDGPLLFASDNSREDLGRLVAEIFGPRPAGGQ